MILIWDEDYNELISFLKGQKEKPFLLCDENTFNACGKSIVEKLKKEQLDYDLLILPNDAHADEKNICKVMLNTGDNHLIVSIGSGSITDIARFSAYKQKLRFISVPTAPSMDGYASSVAALTIDGLKTTVLASAPEKIFANIEVIKNSPKILKLAGFGDLMGKFTALSDWKLANIIVEEDINWDVWNTMYNTCEKTLKNIGESEFEKLLLEGLVKSGELIAVVGNSRPASGSEHHISHYLEFLGYDLFHGIKVGISTFYSIKLYKYLLNFDLEDIERFQDVRIDIDEWKREIEENFPKIQSRIIGENIERIKDFNNANYRAEILERIKNKRNEIYGIAKSLTGKESELLEGYKKLGFSVDPEEWGIKKEDIKKALLYSLYIRERFTILTLYQFLGILKELVQNVII